jgi:hypothetical protein
VKTKLLCLLTAICIMLSFIPVSAESAESVCTNASTVTAMIESRRVPPVPTLVSITPDSITLVDDPNIEYSLDGRRWFGPVFTGLTPDTTYTVYARYIGYYNLQPSEASEPLIVKTPLRYQDKGEQTAPSLELISKTGTSVTLNEIEGAEYRYQGEVWQDSNTFYNLSPATKYIFYARMKETDDLKRSPESAPLTVTTNASGGFPFVPPKNMTDGVIKSGWAYIITPDQGSVAPNDKGVVSPSRSGYPPFFFEHLGDNKYYIHGADGGYLSYQGTLKRGTQIIISEKPCVWKVYSQNAGGYAEYNFNVASNTKYYIRLGVGYMAEDEEEDGEVITYTGVTLGEDTSNRFQRDGAQFTLITLDQSNAGLPQWWKEYVEGRTEPTYDVETITYEHPKNDKKQTDGQETSGGTSPGETVPVTANPSNTKFVMNGKPVSVTAAYNINNTNYLQIRAIAAMLNGTAAQFDIGWDGKYAVIEPGKPFSGTVTETRLQSTDNVRKSDTKFKMNYEVFSFSDARLIDGSTNYIQLREFAKKLAGTASQFNVYWDSAAGRAVIQPGIYYTGEEVLIQTPDETDTGDEESEKDIYYIKSAKNENFVIEVSDASKENGAKLIIHSRTGNDNQKFKLTNLAGDVHVILGVQSGKWWTSGGKKGDVLTQTVNAPDSNSLTFRLIKQADGTYRIMDYKGLYAGVSDSKMEDGANIIVQPEASDKSQIFILERAK